MKTVDLVTARVGQQLTDLIRSLWPTRLRVRWRRGMSWCLRGTVAALAPVLAGCGHTNLSQVHTYVARDTARNEFSFVRVTIRANALTSKTRYAAHWKPASAVDEYFNADTAPPLRDEENPEATIRKAQNKIVGGLSDQLIEASRGDDPEAIRSLEERLALAMGLTRRIKAKQTSSVSEAPAEKFVIVWSSNPEVVFEQIAQVVEKQESEGAILDTVSALRGAEREREGHLNEVASTLWQALLADTGSLKRAVAVDAPDADVTRAQKELAGSLEIYRWRLKDFLEGSR